MLNARLDNGITIQRSAAFVKTLVIFAGTTPVSLWSCLGMHVRKPSMGLSKGDRNGGESTTVANLHGSPMDWVAHHGSEPFLTPDRVEKSPSKINRRCYRAGGRLTHFVTETGTWGIAGQILERELALRGGGLAEADYGRLN